MKNTAQEEQANLGTASIESIQLRLPLVSYTIDPENTNLILPTITDLSMRALQVSLTAPVEASNLGLADMSVISNKIVLITYSNYVPEPVDLTLPTISALSLA